MFHTFASFSGNAWVCYSKHPQNIFKYPYPLGSCLGLQTPVHSECSAEEVCYCSCSSYLAKQCGCDWSTVLLSLTSWISDPPQKSWHRKLYVGSSLHSCSQSACLLVGYPKPPLFTPPILSPFSLPPSRFCSPPALFLIIPYLSPSPPCSAPTSPYLLSL